MVFCGIPKPDVFENCWSGWERRDGEHGVEPSGNPQRGQSSNQTYNGVRGCSPQRGPRTEPLVSESGVQCSLAENILALEHSIELQ